MGGSERRSSGGTSSARSPSCCASGARRRASSSPRRPASRSRSRAGETDAAVEMGLFVAGEGRRSYGRTTTASMPHRTVLTLRRPVGVAALLISFNTPLPNVAWKAFPSIFCGNGSDPEAVRAHAALGALARPALPRSGAAAGRAERRSRASARRRACRSSRTRASISSASPARRATGRAPRRGGRRRLAKTVMELGGKNALVVCDDADLDRAVEWTLASAFSNAGPAVRGGEPHRRVRRRLRRLRRAPRRGRRPAGRRRPRDQRGEHGADPRRRHRRAGGRRDRAPRRRARR